MKFSFVIAAAAVCGVCSAQSVSTRWALSLSGTGNERLVARPGGGVFLLSRADSPEKITAFSKTGSVDWVMSGLAYPNSHTVGPDGSLYIVDLIGDVNGIWRIRRFGLNGALTGTKEIPLNRPAAPTVPTGIRVSEGGILAFSYNNYFDEGLRMVRLNHDLSVTIDRFTPQGWRGRTDIDQNGDVVTAENGKVNRYGPTGNLKLSSNAGMPASMALLPNGIVLTGGYWSDNQGSSGTNTSRINTFGSFIRLADDQGQYVVNYGPLVYTFGNGQMQPRAQMTRRTLAGNFLWTRDFGYNGQAEAFGGDPWLNGYVTVTTAVTNGKRLHKINSAGKTLWYRTGGLSAAVSPFNYDIFQMDKASNRIRIYCFQQAPIGKPDSYIVANTSTLDVNVGENDQYGVDAGYMLVTPPAQGIATLQTNGQLTYQPQTGFTGPVTLTYRAEKPGLTPSGPITVTINVTP